MIESTLSVVHERPATDETITARVTVCRTIHGLHEHGLVVVLTENSTPESFGFALECDPGAWNGLGDVIDTLAPPSWLITPRPPFD